MINKYASFFILGAVAAISMSFAPADDKQISIAYSKADGSSVRVTAVTPNILRVENTPAGYVPTAKTPTTESTLKIKPSQINPLEISGTVLTTASGIEASIDANSGKLTVSAPGLTVIDSGERTVADGRQQILLSVGQEGSFYGAGERGHSFNLRGDTLVMYNKQNYGYTAGDPRISQMNITMPLFISSTGYAIVFDDYAPATMTLTDPIVYTTESTSPVAYYIVYGEGNLPTTSKHLSELTGRQPLAPLWSLGYITSKYGYHDQEETLGVIDTLKTRGYPVDGIVLDLYWYGKEEDMGRLEWDPVQWPDPVGMLDSLKRQGVNLVAISQPYVLSNGRGVDNFNFLSENKMLALDSVGNTQPVTIWVGEGGMFDVSNPATIEWLSKRYKDLTDMGITGWWGDLGEPEVHPEGAVHNNGLTARQYHNRYGNDWSRIIADLFAEQYPDVRLMTLMRGGTTGLQQFSVFPWSTDVSRSWGGLQPQVNIMLNSGLSGMGYMSHDVGGFAIDPENPVDPELYVRWLQLGLFSPVLRTHAQQVAEPYLYPEQQDIILPLIKARYSWLPYNYSLAFENAIDGTPFVRPLEYYSGSQAADAISDEYLWGRDVLVAPVMTQGTTSRSVKFPDGSDRWIDLLNPANVYSGGTTVVDYPAPLNVLPLFVREGAFIPSAPYAMENTGDYNSNTYTVDYYPLNGSKSEYTLYEDDLKSTRSIDNNEYLCLIFKGEEEYGTINIDITSAGTYPGMGPTKDLQLRIHNILRQPKQVVVDGKTLNLAYNPQDNTLNVPVKYTVGTPCSIIVRQ